MLLYTYTPLFIYKIQILMNNIWLLYKLWCILVNQTTKHFTKE